MQANRSYTEPGGVFSATQVPAQRNARSLDTQEGTGVPLGGGGGGGGGGYGPRGQYLGTSDPLERCDIIFLLYLPVSQQLALQTLEARVPGLPCRRCASVDQNFILPHRPSNSSTSSPFAHATHVQLGKALR